MASNLRVDTILPSTGTTLGIGTANGTINFLGNSNIVTSGTLTAASASITGNLGVGGVLTYEDVTNVDSVGVITARDGLRVTGIATIADSIYAGGTPLTESDLNWTHDTYQRPHIFSGLTGGFPADGAVVAASAGENSSNSRIGAFIFGCKTSSTTGVSNSGLKAFIEGFTNTNVSDAWKTGGYMKFSTRADNATAPQERLRIDSNGHVLPGLNNAYDLGSTAKGWRNVYMNDLNLSNMKGDTNDVDGTQGSWTIQEGKDDLYIINRLNGKKFKIKMEEIS